MLTSQLTWFGFPLLQCFPPFTQLYTDFKFVLRVFRAAPQRGVASAEGEGDGLQTGHAGDHQPEEPVATATALGGHPAHHQQGHQPRQGLHLGQPAGDERRLKDESLY